MTVAELQRTVANYPEASGDELTDKIYEVIKAELARGADRVQVHADLYEYYMLMGEIGMRDARRAAGEVLAYLDGYCSPSAAL